MDLFAKNPKCLSIPHRGIAGFQRDQGLLAKLLGPLPKVALQAPPLIELDWPGSEGEVLTETSSAANLFPLLTKLDSKQQSLQDDARAEVARRGADLLPRLKVIITSSESPDPGDEIRANACLALALAAGESNTEATALLVTTLTKDPSAKVRLGAARAIGQWRNPALPAIEGLASALSDDEEDVRFSTASTLRQLGPAAAPASKALIDSLADFPDGIALFSPGSVAYEALGTIGEPTIIHLVSALGRDNPRITIPLCQHTCRLENFILGDKNGKIHPRI